MNDDFLYKALPPIPSDLEDRVLMRIHELQGNTIHGRIGNKLIQGAVTWCVKHRVLAIIGAMLLLVACAVGIVKISGFVVRESAEPPEKAPGGIRPVSQRFVARTEALEALTFEVRMPIWAPEGYEMSDRAMVTLPTEDSALGEAWQVWLCWEKSDGTEILLLAFPSIYYRGDELRFGPDSVKEIDIGGKPAMAVQGNWESSGTAWNKSAGGNVLWVEGNTSYWLQSSWVSLDELTRMARSVQFP